MTSFLTSLDLMMKLLMFLLLTLAVFPQQKKICITVDDMPLVSYGIRDTEYQTQTLQRLMRKLSTASTRAIGFVNEIQLYEDDKLILYKVKLMEQWLTSGLEIGNHTFSHPDYNNTDYKDYTANILKGESVIRELCEKHGSSLRYFRHPYLHAGQTRERADSLDNFLAAHGYITAPVTIDTDDYLFAFAYHRAFHSDNAELAERIGSDYIAYMAEKLTHFENLSDSLFGRNIAHTLLIHANLLNADYIDKLLEVFQEKGYQFVTLEEALKDEAYATPVTKYGKWGISWIDRWALSAGKKGDFFSGDPQVPEYVREMTR